MRRSPLLLGLLALFALPALAEDPPPIEERLHEIMQRLMTGTAEEQAKAREELRALVMREKPGMQTLGLAPTEARVIVLGGPGGAPTEQMTGEWQEDGRSGRYTLESIKPGHYFLKAWVKGPEGEEKRTEEEGSLAELRKKYPFLKDVLLLGVESRFTGRMVDLTLEHREMRNGMRLRRPGEELRFHLALPEGAGLLVDQVEKGSEAEKLGLERFDIVLKVGGELVTKPEQLDSIGEQPVEILRRAQSRTLNKRS